MFGRKNEKNQGLSPFVFKNGGSTFPKRVRSVQSMTPNEKRAHDTGDSTSDAPVRRHSPTRVARRRNDDSSRAHVETMET